MPSEETSPYVADRQQRGMGPQVLAWAALTLLVWGAAWVMMEGDPRGFLSEAQLAQTLQAEAPHPDDLPWARNRLQQAGVTHKMPTWTLRQWQDELPGLTQEERVLRELAQWNLAEPTRRWEDIWTGRAFEMELALSGISSGQAVTHQQWLEAALQVLETSAGSQTGVEPPPGEEQLRGFYERHEPLFNLPETYTVRHLFLAAHEGTPEEDRAVKEQAIKVLAARLAAGEPLDKLAAQYSEDEATKQLGGLLPKFSAERMPADFLEIVQTAEVGKVIGPVKTALGYHLLRVEAREPARDLSFEEARPLIVAAHQQARATAARLEALAAAGEGAATP